MTNLTQLLSEYLASEHRPACLPDSEGVFTFDAGQGMLFCASELEDGKLELFASPGYMPAAELASAGARIGAGDDEEVDDEDDVELERWQAHGLDWSIELDRESGLVTLTGLTLEAPWSLDGLVAAVEAFREIYITWEARLLPTRDPETAVPKADGQAHEFAPYPRA